MPIIEMDISERIQRHLAAVRVMSCMVFPDDAKQRASSEITFRTILADWYSATFAKLETCSAKAYQVEVEERACVVRLRTVWPAVFALNRLK